MGEDVNLIEAIDVVLGGSSKAAFSLSPTRPNVVRAYRATIDGLCNAFSQSVAIFAFEVIGINGATIDTSGRDGNPTFQPGAAAPAGMQPGDPGKAGTAGGNAIPGGNVTIIGQSFSGNLLILAKGGTGGRGQDGGHGQTGLAGKDGVQNEEESRNLATGGTGGTGGAGGAPGPAGTSAPGGNVNVLLATKQPQNSIQVDCSGGRGVPPASPGRGGDPGRGGYGQKYGTPVTIGHGGYEHDIPSYDGKGNDGAKGGRGLTLPDPPGGAAGLNGVVKFDVVGLEGLSEVQSARLVQLILTEAEGLYLNERYTEAFPLLVFVSSIGRARSRLTSK